MKPTFKNIPALISGKSYCVWGIVFYFLCMEEHKHIMSCTGGDQYFRNSSKGEELYPFCCSASYIKIVLLTASRGLCCDSFAVFLYSVFKVMPWEQNFSFKTWISKCFKIHRHLRYVWKLLYLIRARGNIIHAGLNSVGLASLQIIPLLFNLPRRTAFNMLWNPLGYDDCLKNWVVTVIAGQFTVQNWGHSSLSVELLIAIFDSCFFMNSSKKSEDMNPMKYVYITVWSWAQLFSWPNWRYWNLVNSQFRNIYTTDWLEKE